MFYNNVETPQNPSLITPYTLFHFIVGMYSFVVLRWAFNRLTITQDFIIWFIAHGIYELHDVHEPNPSNSSINSFGDTIAAMSGFVLMAAIFNYKVWNIIEVLIGGVIVCLANFLIHEPPQ